MGGLAGAGGSHGGDRKDERRDRVQYRGKALQPLGGKSITVRWDDLG